MKIENVGVASAFGLGKSVIPNGLPALFLFGEVKSQLGIFRSDNNGQTWLPLNDAQHQFGWITGLTGVPRIYGRIYLATTGRGIIYGDRIPSRNIQISMSNGL